MTAPLMDSYLMVGHRPSPSATTPDDLLDVAQDDDSGAGLHAEFRYSVRAPGTYGIVVSATAAHRATCNCAMREPRQMESPTVHGGTRRSPLPFTSSASVGSVRHSRGPLTCSLTLTPAMIPYASYKLIHILGIALALVALGGMAVHALNGGLKAENAARKLLIAMHGVGVFLILLGGFGLLARIGFAHGSGFPLWLWVKLGLWTAFVVIAAVPYRRPQSGPALLVALPLLAMTAAAMALYKPT